MVPSFPWHVELHLKETEHAHLRAGSCDEKVTCFNWDLKNVYFPENYFSYLIFE
jgi:hypothetical protein